MYAFNAGYPGSSSVPTVNVGPYALKACVLQSSGNFLTQQCDGFAIQPTVTPTFAPSGPSLSPTMPPTVISIGFYYKSSYQWSSCGDNPQTSSYPLGVCYSNLGVYTMYSVTPVVGNSFTITTTTFADAQCQVFNSISFQTVSTACSSLTKYGIRYNPTMAPTQFPTAPTLSPSGPSRQPTNTYSPTWQPTTSAPTLHPTPTSRPTPPPPYEYLVPIFSFVFVLAVVMAVLRFLRVREHLLKDKELERNQFEVKLHLDRESSTKTIPSFEITRWELLVAFFVWKAPIDATSDETAENLAIASTMKRLSRRFTRAFRQVPPPRPQRSDSLENLPDVSACDAGAGGDADGDGDEEDAFGNKITPASTTSVNEGEFMSATSLFSWFWGDAREEAANVPDWTCNTTAGGTALFDWIPVGNGTGVLYNDPFSQTGATEVDKAHDEIKDGTDYDGAQVDELAPQLSAVNDQIQVPRSRLSIRQRLSRVFSSPFSGSDAEGGRTDASDSAGRSNSFVDRLVTLKFISKNAGQAYMEEDQVGTSAAPVIQREEELKNAALSIGQLKPPQPSTPTPPPPAPSRQSGKKAAQGKKSTKSRTPPPPARPTTASQPSDGPNVTSDAVKTQLQKKLAKP